MAPRGLDVNVTAHDERVRGFARIAGMRQLIAAAVLAVLAVAARAAETRRLVAAAPRADDPALIRQREAFAAMGREARARDLVLVEAVGAHGAALRRRYGLPEDGFAAALIGKDGGVKLRSTEPLDGAALLPLIDSMPMRQRERRERGE